MATGRILAATQVAYLSLTDDEKRNPLIEPIEKKLSEDKNPDIRDYDSDISWEKMPNGLKNTMGGYLLKTQSLYPQPTARQVNEALSNRNNIDLPYIDRSNNDIFKYTKSTCEDTMRFLAKSNDVGRSKEDIRSGHGNSPCCILATPITPLFFIFRGAGGLIYDGYGCIKAKCDDSKEEALHRMIIGPTHQVMK